MLSITLILLSEAKMNVTAISANEVNNVCGNWNQNMQFWTPEVELAQHLHIWYDLLKHPNQRCADAKLILAV